MSFARFKIGRLMSGLAVASTLALMTSPGMAEVKTLEDALISAYRSNPTLLAQRAALRATDENVAVAVSNWRPTVSVSGSYSRSYSDTSTTRIDPNTGVPLSGQTQLDSKSWQISGSQTIFRGLRSFNEFRQAKAGVKAGRAQLTTVEQQVLFDTVSAYMDVLRDEAVLRLAQNNVSVLKRQLEASEDRFRVGEITRTDVAQSEARLSGAQSNMISAEAQLIASRAAFEQVVGELPSGLNSPPELPPLPATEQEAESRARNNNPVLSAARESEKASRHGVDVAKGALLPTISMSASYGEQESDFRDIQLPATDPVSARQGATVSASISVPLYQSGAEYARIRQAKELNSQDRLQIIEAERSVVETVRNAWEGLRSARATIVASREQVRANEIAFEGVQQEAQVGSRTTLDVLDAEQELLDSRVALVRAERDEYVAAFALLASIGDLTAGRLNLPVPSYDPERHYDSVKFMPVGWWSRKGE